MKAETFQLIDLKQNLVYIENVYIDELNLPIHSHLKGQLLYAEGGVIHIFTENNHWYLPARFYMWIPAGLKHSIISHSDHISLFNYYFTIDKDDQEFYQKPNICMVNDMLREMILYTKNWSGGITKKDNTKLAFMNAIKAILPEMISISPAPFSINHPYPKDKRLLDIAQFLNQNLETSYSLEEIAKKFGFSSRSLSRLFKESMGFNYVRFLRAIRIAKSLELMNENKYNIYEISLKVGYNSLSTFSNVFKRIMGIRPIDYLSNTTKYKEGDLKKDF